MQERDRCAYCGDPIDAGQAWMKAALAGAERFAHAACLYRDERDPVAAGWEPQESAAG